MSAALAATGARMGRVGADQRRYGHPYFGAGYWFVLSDLAVAVPALDWGTHAHLEYRVAGQFARVHFYRGSESCLRSGGLPAGAQFRDRKSTRLNSSHSQISYAVFCLKKKKNY